MRVVKIKTKDGLEVYCRPGSILDVDRIIGGVNAEYIDMPKCEYEAIEAANRSATFFKPPPSAAGSKGGPQ